MFLVGNAARSRGNTDWTSATHKAQSFTTGGTATLKEVQVFGSNWDTSTRVSIYSDSSGEPGSELRTGRLSFNPGYAVYFTFDNLALTASTTYWVVLEGNGILQRLSNSGEDALTGWSLGDRMQVKTGGSSWHQHPLVAAMRVEVLGTPTAAATAVDPPTACSCVEAVLRPRVFLDT